MKQCVENHVLAIAKVDATTIVLVVAKKVVLSVVKVVVKVVVKALA